MCNTKLSKCTHRVCCGHPSASQVPPCPLTRLIWGGGYIQGESEVESTPAPLSDVSLMGRRGGVRFRGPGCPPPSGQVPTPPLFLMQACSGPVHPQYPAPGVRGTRCGCEQADPHLESFFPFNFPFSPYFHTPKLSFLYLCIFGDQIWSRKMMSFFLNHSSDAFWICYNVWYNMLKMLHWSILEIILTSSFPPLHYHGLTRNDWHGFSCLYAYTLTEASNWNPITGLGSAQIPGCFIWFWFLGCGWTHPVDNMIWAAGVAILDWDTLVILAKK